MALRPLHADDFAPLCCAASDRLIWEQHPAKERCTEKGFKKFFTEAMASGGALLASDTATHAVIGTSRFHGLNEADSEIEIGWTFLSRSYWGGKYNGEMKDLMMRHAFKYVDRVVFMVAPNNLRSQRAVQKIGGEREADRIDGYGNQCIAYIITAKTYLS